MALELCLLLPFLVIYDRRRVNHRKRTLFRSDPHRELGVETAHFAVASEETTEIYVRLGFSPINEESNQVEGKGECDIAKGDRVGEWQVESSLFHDEGERWNKLYSSCRKPGLAL